MAKKTTGAPVNVSKVWDSQFHGTGKQHTIYAPQVFFDEWMGDESELKKLVNEWLVKNAGKTPIFKPKALPKGATKALSAKAASFEIDDDDI